MWEPFTEPARRTIVRAQEVAQMFACSYIGTEHIAFALAENDDDVGRVLANAIDRDEMREQLGGARGFPKPEMVFTPGAKLVIERAFENARRLGHNYIGVAHLALGILSNEDRPALRADADLRAMRAELDVIATSDPQATIIDWSQTGGTGESHGATRAMLAALKYFPDLGPPGTQVTITIARPDGEPHTWTFTRGQEQGK